VGVGSSDGVGVFSGVGVSLGAFSGVGVTLGVFSDVGVSLGVLSGVGVSLGVFTGEGVTSGVLTGAGEAVLSPPVSPLLPQAVNANAKIKDSAIVINLFVFIDLFLLCS